MAADIIAEQDFFNLNCISNIIPKVQKSAVVLPLLKGGEPSYVNNQRLLKINIIIN